MNPYVPECTGAVPANTKYLYVYVHGSVTPNINYAISVTFERTSVPYMVSNILPCRIKFYLDQALVLGLVQLLDQAAGQSRHAICMNVKAGLPT